MEDVGSAARQKEALNVRRKDVSTVCSGKKSWMLWLSTLKLHHTHNSVTASHLFHFSFFTTMNCLKVIPRVCQTFHPRPEKKTKKRNQIHTSFVVRKCVWIVLIWCVNVSLSHDKETGSHWEPEKQRDCEWRRQTHLFLIKVETKDNFKSKPNQFERLCGWFTVFVLWLCCGRLGFSVWNCAQNLLLEQLLPVTYKRKCRS